MPIPLAIPVAMAAVSAATQLYGSAQSGKAAKKAASKAAKLHLRTAEENIRRTGLQYSEIRKRTTAGIYASGLEMSGSQENYLRRMRGEMSRELKWQRDMARAEAKAIKKGAAIQARAGMISGVAGAIGTMAGAMSSMGGYKPPGGMTGAPTSFGGFDTGINPVMISPGLANFKVTG